MMKYLRIFPFLVIALLTMYSFAVETNNKANYQDKARTAGKFHSAGTNWQTDGSFSLTEPLHFPYQNPVNNPQSCPIVLSNGDVLLVWNDPDNLAFSRSTDGGENWQTPEFIASGLGYVPDFLSGVYTQTGRAIIIWRDTQALELMMSFSDDNGASWSSPVSITTSGRNEQWTSLSQTLDGTLWLFYCDNVPGNARDIFYVTSTDNGNSWSSEQTFLATFADEWHATVISGDGSTLLAFYQDNSSGYSHIYQMSSIDGGQTWSSPLPIGQVYQDEFRPRALRQTDGTLWLVYGANTPTPVLGTLQNDIYYMTSSDGGTNWSVPERFTYYVGNDDRHNVALLNNQPFASFDSWRWADWNQYQIWYGIIGTTYDTNLPPALFNQHVISPYDNSIVTMRAAVDDESGISSVSGSYDLNGGPTVSFPMYDDGQHNDVNAGDNIWAGQIGPFQVGDNFDFSYHISDISNNTVDPYVSSVGIPFAHTTGNMILSWRENSRLAEGISGFIWGSSAYWPVSDGQDYLYAGGLWVGAQVSGEPRVMNCWFSESDWQQTPGMYYGMVPGPADQVGKVTYDDQQALSAPIGLQVTQRSYQWNTADPDHDDFIIFRYTIKNTGVNGDLDGVFVGMWTDPDLTFQTSPDGAADDLGKYEADRKLAYLYDSQNNPGGYLGVKLLGGFQPHTVNIYPNGGTLDNQDDVTRYFEMQTGLHPDPTAPADYRIFMTHAIYHLAAGDSQTVAFGIVMGNGVDELRTNADAMELRYAQLFGTEAPPENLIAIDKLDGQVPLYWSPAYEPGSTLLSYNIYRTDSPSPIGNVTQDQTHFVDTNVNNEQVYSYYVTAVYNTGESAPSNETTGYPMSLPDEPGKVVSYARPGGRPYGLAFDGSSIWMSNWYSNEIVQFDAATWQWQGSIPAPGGNSCYGMAWDGSSLWVANRTDGGVYQIDLSGNILQFLDVPPGYNGDELLTGLAHENGNIWVMDRNNFVVHKFDAGSGTLIQTIPMPTEFQAPASPQGLGYLPDRETFIVGLLSDGSSKTTIYEVTTTDFTPTGRNFEFNMEYDPGNGGFNSSIRGGLTFNPLTGNYWIGDVWTDMIYEVLPFPAQNNEITFQVDMNVKMQQQLFQPANGDIVVVRGNFNGWSGNDEILSDANGYGIYSGTYNVGGSAGEEIQYKFVISYPGGGALWEENIPNRIFVLTGNPETLPVVFFNDEPGQGGTLVTNTNDDGYGSLRAAINFANSDGQPSLIEFYPTLMGQTIYPQSQLPSLIEDNTAINGDIDNDGLPDIEISQGSPDIINGLVIESAYNTINGLLINNFNGPGGPGYGAIRIQGPNAHHNTVTGCYIGTDLSKSENRANRSGILIFNGAHNNIIGGSGFGESNIIFNNVFGVYITDNGTNGNTITRNSISHNSNNGIVVAAGANNGITPPVITDFDGSTITGTTVPNSIVEVFADALNQGEEFLGDVQSDGSGNFSFNGPFPEDRFYNVNVTDPDGNTSGFSAYPLRQNEINANHWRVQLLNNGTFAQDVLGLLGGNGAGGEFPKGSGIYVVFSGGHYLGTIKNGTPSVSQIEYTNSDYLPGKIINTSPAPLDQLFPEYPLLGKNKVYVIDSTRSGSDWDNWPVDDGAPVDANGEPLLLSSQDSWTIFNDVAPFVHSGTGDPVLGLEVQRSTYSYTLPGVNDAFIVKWKIINKSNNNYTDTYFGTWFDPDVDDWTNDLIGTDTTLNMGFVYNANDNDAPRAFGACMLKGPIADGQGLGLTATSGLPVGEFPDNDDQRYNLLKGLDRWGNAKPFGPYDFTGDPLTQVGHLDWQPADKWLIFSSGPFTLYAGNVQEVVVACIGAAGTDRLDAVAKLKETTAQVREFYNRPTLTISQTKGVPNYKTPVYISLSNAKDLLGADFTIQYDNSFLDLLKVDIKLTPLTTGFTLSSNVIQNQGTVSLAIANASPPETELSGVLIKLPFKVKNNTPAGSMSALTFTEAVLSFQNDPLVPVVPVTINGGLEVVTGVLFGDVNQNGAYDLIDAVLILKALVEMYDEITPFQELLADANANGNLAMNDALLVLDELVLNKSGLNSLAGSSADTSVDVSLDVPLIQGQIGQKVTIPLSSDDFEQLFGLDATFRYDHHALRLESIEKAGSEDMLVSNRQIPGYAHLAVVNTAGIGNQRGDLVYLDFTILKEGDHQITIEKSLGVPSSEEIANLLLPKEFKLKQNYPNPFNPTTMIQYQLPKPAKVALEIYNIRGQRVETLVNEYKDAGYYSVEWNAGRISSGVYFYRLQAGDFTMVKKCVFVK